MKFSNELLLELKQNSVISKDTLLHILSQFFPSMNRAYSYRIISELLKNNHLYKIDSDTYTSEKKKNFDYTLLDEKILKCVDGYGEYVIWDSNILNKWINHLLNAVITFVEVDEDLLGVVYNELKAHGYKHILLNPNLNEFNKYFDSQLVIIRPLPKMYLELGYKISIERLIVQIYSDKILSSLYSDLEMSEMLNEIFKTYNISLNRLYHYARRKKIYDEFHNYLINNIDRRYLYHD